MYPSYEDSISIFFDTRDSFAFTALQEHCLLMLVGSAVDRFLLFPSVTMPLPLSDTKAHETSHSPCGSSASPGGSMGSSHPVLEAAGSCLCAYGGISWR